MVWSIMAGKVPGKWRFRLQRWIVGAGFGEGFSSFRLWRFGRSNQTQNLRAFTEVVRSSKRFLLKGNGLVARRTNERRVSLAICLPEHIAAHDAPATHRNPHCGSFVRSHETPRRMRIPQDYTLESAR